MDYIQVAIETSREAVEALSYFLVEDEAGGVEICDSQDVLNQDKEEVIFDLIDESLISDNTDTVIVKAYFSDQVDIREKITHIEDHLKVIKQFLNIGTGKISLLNIPEEKWANEWKKYYKPVKLGKNIVIKPTWEAYQTTSEDELIIEMDPGMAFGTGTHETTAMCAMFLEKYLKSEYTLIDIGTGSGILGIIGAKLGASKVIGVDIDKVAIKVAGENISQNDVQSIMEVRCGNLTQVVSEQGDLVVSNIIADVIILLSEMVDKVIKPGGIWISSGIIEDRKDDVIRSIEKADFEIIEICEEKDWVAIVAIKR